MAQLDKFGVIFDLDGVLVDSADAHYESWRRLGIEIGQSISRQQFRATFGRRNREIIPQFFGQVSSKQIAQLGDRKEHIYRDLIRSNPPIVPGAVELVADLKNHGARLAIGSSAPRENIDLILRAAAWGDKFDAIISAADVTRGKPDPQVFEISCERLHLAADRCIVVEDAPVGVQAAKAAGARCIAVVMESSREALRDADLIVDKLADLSAQSLLALLAS